MAANSLDMQFFSRDDMAIQISNMWDEWYDYRKPAMARWEEVNQYRFATSTKETTNASVGGFSPDQSARQGWSHSTHLPKLCNIADNLSANYMMAMFSRPDWVMFEGHDEKSQSEKKRKVAEAYITTKCKLNNFRNEIQKCIDDWIGTGNCFGIVTYEAEKYVDPDTGMEEVGYQGPKLERISPYDIVFNPLSTSFARSPKIISRLKSMGELLREAEDCPELGYDVEKIKDVIGRRTTATGVKNTRVLDKYRYLELSGIGSATEYLRSGIVEIIEFYGDLYNSTTGEFLKNHVITIADRSTVLRCMPVPTWGGMAPIFHCGWRTRPETLWAQGPLENLVGLQYMINHLQNTKADAFDEFVCPIEVTKGDVTREGSRFGGLLADSYHVDGVDGDVQLMRPDPSFLQANMDIQYLENLMEMYAGSPKEAMGIRSPGEKTAYEVQSLQNAAGRIFQNKIDYFSENFVEPVVNAFIAVSARNLSGPDVVQITDDDFGAIEFRQITKQDILSNGRLVPVGSRHFAEQARLAQTISTLRQVLGPEELAHISSLDMARVAVEAAGVSNMLKVTKFIRLGEMSEARQVQGQLQEEEFMVATQPTPEDLM